MKIFNTKISKSPSLDELEKIVESGKKIRANEIPFNEIKNLCELLGAEYAPKLRTGGSSEKFTHKILRSVPHYTNGIFTIHLLHGKKPMISKRDYTKILYRVLSTIIQLKRNLGEK